MKVKKVLAIIGILLVIILTNTCVFADLVVPEWERRPKTPVVEEESHIVTYIIIAVVVAVVAALIVFCINKKRRKDKNEK